MSITISGTTGIDAGSLPVANTGKISAGSGLPAILNTAGVDRVIVDTAGNVGIGTTTPATTLDVVGAGRFQQQATSGTSGAIIIKEDSGSVNGGVLQWVNPANTFQRGAIKVKPDSSWEIYNGYYNVMFKISSAGDFLATLGTGGLGYGTGAGGTVTQLTNKSTAVTLNKPSGIITMNSAAFAAGSTTSFVLNNNLIAAADDVIVTLGAGSYSPYAYNVWCYPVANVLTIFVKNISGINLSESVVINFAIVRGATA